MPDLLRQRLSPLLLAATAFLPAAAGAQGVYKCSIDGKVSYQSSPCPTGGKAIDIASGPTETELAEARRRADAEKHRAAEVAAPTARQPSLAVAGGVNCAQLNQSRAEAYGRRNGAVRSSKQSGIDDSTYVVQQQSRIDSLESRMARGGCKSN